VTEMNAINWNARLWAKFRSFVRLLNISGPLSLGIKSILVPKLSFVERSDADSTASVMICRHRGSNECPTTYDEEQCAISIEVSKAMIICCKAFINPRVATSMNHVSVPSISGT
jgi:hypothetical protein